MPQAVGAASNGKSTKSCFRAETTLSYRRGHRDRAALPFGEGQSILPASGPPPLPALACCLSDSTSTAVEMVGKTARLAAHRTLIPILAAWPWSSPLRLPPPSVVGVAGVQATCAMRQVRCATPTTTPILALAPGSGYNALVTTCWGGFMRREDIPKYKSLCDEMRGLPRSLATVLGNSAPIGCQLFLPYGVFIGQEAKISKASWSNLRKASRCSKTRGRISWVWGWANPSEHNAQLPDRAGRR